MTAWAALRGHGIRYRFDRELFRRGFRYATKAYLITLLAFLVLRSNIFLLRRHYGPAELGLYSIAAQIADVLSIVPQSVALVLFPRLVREPGGRWHATKRAALTTGGLMLVTCGTAAVAAGPLIRLLYGSSYGPSATVLRIMLPGVFCLGVANSSPSTSAPRESRGPCSVSGAGSGARRSAQPRPRSESRRRRSRRRTLDDVRVRARSRSS